ncbi:MAG: hypothetical protein ACI8ZN_001162 [Bacteroidia bacterium]|jgi:hypothetical protein
MFGIFKRKTKVQILEKKYESLLEASYKLSRINRKQGDAKMAEADSVLQEINAINELNA